MRTNYNMLNEIDMLVNELNPSLVKSARNFEALMQMKGISHQFFLS